MRGDRVKQVTDRCHTTTEHWMAMARPGGGQFGSEVQNEIDERFPSGSGLNELDWERRMGYG